MRALDTAVPETTSIEGQAFEIERLSAPKSRKTTSVDAKPQFSNSEIIERALEEVEAASDNEAANRAQRDERVS